MKFILSGGQQRKSAVWKEEWNHYNKAVLVEVDWSTGKVEMILDYISPEKYIANNSANIVFKAASLYKNKLYLCTQTEVMIYAYPSLEKIQHISHPCFNDLHHVAVINGKTYVVSTGLDMVIVLDEDFYIVEEINVLEKSPWHRFSKEIDYRKVETTKPHEAHPNYVFEIDGEAWVSRFEQKDAVCLSDFTKRIDVGIERIHDGIVHGDFVYFTTINGMVCVVNKYTYKTENIYDLNDNYDVDNPLGWCRGLFVNNDRLFVAFSCLRTTKIRENLAWIKNRFEQSKDQMRTMPTRLVEYNMNSRSIVKEVDVSDVGLDAIFSVHKS